jgi:NAD(P)-dependent dehydrogenase (short-subunit alcohol dehydrogenase family)
MASVVTGASSGIGKEIAKGLARLGGRVILACRDPGRGEAARKEIASETGNDDVALALVDVASQRSIREFAATFLKEEKRVSVLVNNAGIWSQRREESPDGIELTWATNMLGYSLLTSLLLPALREGGGPARIVNVASEFARDLDLDDVEFKRRHYSGPTAYAQSKQANRMWTWALDRRLAGSGITANAMHPGGVNTPLFRKAGGLLGPTASVLMSVAGRSPEQGADTAVWLASSPEVEGQHGKFFVDRQEKACRFRGEEGEERLYRLTEAMTKIGPSVLRRG